MVAPTTQRYETSQDILGGGAGVKPTYEELLSSSSFPDLLAILVWIEEKSVDFS